MFNEFTSIVATALFVAVSFCVLIFAVTSCVQQDLQDANKLKAECINAKGTVISSGNSSFHCIRSPQ